MNGATSAHAVPSILFRIVRSSAATGARNAAVSHAATIGQREALCFDKDQ
jgi:hypothetical protein